MCHVHLCIGGDVGAKCDNFLVECLINPSIAGGDEAKDTNAGNANTVQAHCHTRRLSLCNIFEISVSFA